MIKCTKCGKEQEVDAFYREKGKTMSICKSCRNFITRQSKQNRHQEKLRYDRKHSREYYQRNKEERHAKMSAYRSSIGGRFSSIRAVARYHGRVWNLTLKQFTTLYTQPCFVIGCKERTSGLDRADNTQGYTILNARASCYRHNIMKNDLTDAECYLKMKEFVNWYETLG